MKPIASAILFAVASLSIQASPILAQSSSPGAQLQTSNATALPQFVPSTGQTKYTLAVQENNSPSTAAREAAEALSAKFAGITTGSISKSDETMAEAAPATPVEHAAQPLLASASQRAAQPTDGRAIVIASNQSPDESSPKKSAGDAAKANESVRRIPRTAVAKETRSHFRGATGASLAAVGEKVGFLDKLTNPALWP